MILYEYPLSERIRTFLRMEHLFGRFFVLMKSGDAVSHHYALSTLYEIIEIGSRTDFRGDLLRELEKQKQILNAFRGNPAIAEGLLDAHIRTVEQAIRQTLEVQRKIGQSILENPWLSAIQTRIVIPGGTCEFDIPTYHQWQHESSMFRQERLLKWAQPLLPFFEATQLLLKMLRDAGISQKVIAVKGVFQQAISQQKTFQLLRISIPDDLRVSPEVSANRLLVSVRLMRTDYEMQPKLVADDHAIEITLCA